MYVEKVPITCSAIIQTSMFYTGKFVKLLGLIHHYLINMSWVKAIQNFRKIAFCQNRISESNGLQINGRLTLFAGTQKVNYYTSFQHLLQFSPFKKVHKCLAGFVKSTNLMFDDIKSQSWHKEG